MCSVVFLLRVCYYEITKRKKSKLFQKNFFNRKNKILNYKTKMPKDLKKKIYPVRKFHPLRRGCNAYSFLQRKNTDLKSSFSNGVYGKELIMDLLDCDPKIIRSKKNFTIFKRTLRLVKS